MYFYNPGERAVKELVTGIQARTFWGSEMLVAVVDLDANTQLPRHSHPHEQVGIVLEGELKMTVEEESKMLQVGDVYIIPGGVEHSAQTGERPAKVLDVFSPVREEYKY